MGWYIKYENSSGIIEINYTGDVKDSDLREASKRRISMQEETGSNLILVDASKSRGGPSAMDLYDLPDKIYPESNVRRDTRIAFVLPQREKARELAHFFQTAARNRGWVIELFDYRENAVSWLISVRGHSKDNSLEK